MIYLDLLIGFLKVGCFSFGGAYAAIPLIREVVLSYGWVSEEMLTDMIAVSESTPGPIMVNLATYIGSSQAGFPGAVLATLAVVLPAFVIILLIMAACTYNSPVYLFRSSEKDHIDCFTCFISFLFLRYYAESVSSDHAHCRSRTPCQRSTYVSSVYFSHSDTYILSVLE